MICIPYNIVLYLAFIIVGMVCFVLGQAAGVRWAKRTMKNGFNKLK